VNSRFYTVHENRRFSDGFVIQGNLKSEGFAEYAQVAPGRRRALKGSARFNQISRRSRIRDYD
jgi:hypothetical protein